jgi:hypothetical protein
MGINVNNRPSYFSNCVCSVVTFACMLNACDSWCVFTLHILINALKHNGCYIYLLLHH